MRGRSTKVVTTPQVEDPEPKKISAVLASYNMKAISFFLILVTIVSLSVLYPVDSKSIDDLALEKITANNEAFNRQKVKHGVERTARVDHGNSVSSAQKNGKTKKRTPLVPSQQQVTPLSVDQGPRTLGAILPEEARQYEHHVTELRRLFDNGRGDMAATLSYGDMLHGQGIFSAFIKT